MIRIAEIVQEKKARVRAVVERYPAGSIHLAILQVGDHPASTVYIRGKLRDCAEVGIVGEHYHYPADAAPEELLARIDALNRDPLCRGIIVQLPLPFSKADEQRVLDAIVPEKDVDGFRRDSAHVSCTPRGILSVLRHVADVRGWDGLAGKVVCVVGRSRIVGKPTAALLIDEGCTVVSCNSHTVDLDRWLAQADIIVCAVGQADFLHPGRAVDYRDKVILDVGINRDADGHLCGDCSRALYDTVEWITPVPGGIGLMTRVSLLENVVDGL